MFSTLSWYHEWQSVILACWLHNITAKCPVLTCDIAWDLPINIKRNQLNWSYKTLLDSSYYTEFLSQNMSVSSIWPKPGISQDIVANIENRIERLEYNFQVKEARNFDAFKPQPQTFPPFQCQMFTPLHCWVAGGVVILNFLII